ncbi:glutamate ABC transporter substrate-binding protein [Corynebacterium freiburgense]|uniref:glutamate ABC transporter substrate-binding protein n=1 Tax=Corynebacterium freiburgense TaxID=556548 RepID=UPI0003FA3746|nr:glutamate ABC transporter substrate-binding protein [Corynebacterium freiburgense]WJZ02908.1 ABC transporter glutamine-binding protein GlnH precursor [Corynebacterium freiburgense]
MKRFRSTLTALASLTIAASTLVACGDSGGAGLMANIESGKVTLGTKYDQPGLGLRNSDGSMSGLDVDVATYVVNSIAKDKGWKEPEITWRETPSAQRETMLKNGEVDMITATYSINDGRANAVNFGGPYLLTHQALLIRADNNEVNSLKDLEKGKILCSVSGSTPAQKVKDALPGVQLQEYDTYSSCVEALHQSKVDALTTDATILYGYAAQYGDEFEVVEMKKDDGEPFTNEHYGIGVAKDDQEATDAVNKALKAMYDDGSFDKFVQANLGDDASVVTKGSPGDLSFLSK